ncbi:MAG: CaiB/BaiF CoA transferase family protein [Acidimicrobiales bacterium]
MPGPLVGVKVLELAGIGPAPFCCMMLADAGADVLRVERVSGGPTGGLTGNKDGSAGPGAPHWDLLNRGRRSLAIDLKDPANVELVLKAASKADILVEGWRPGVAERLGVGPEACMERNPRLVYGRMTGWGQDGPLAVRAGHDIDYIAISGALWAIGRKGDRPVPPINLVGDFGGGGMLAAFGLLAALVEVGRSGQGQVVDIAMVDGASVLMTMVYALRGFGVWQDDRGANLLDTGAPFYEVYETADSKYMAVGAIEPQFYAELLKGLGIDSDGDLPGQMDRSGWPQMKERFARIFRTRTRAEWESVFDGTDACVAPVLSPTEAPLHSHNQARSTYVEIDGQTQPAPAPRFSRTPSTIVRPAPQPGAGGEDALREWGIT